MECLTVVMFAHMTILMIQTEILFVIATMYVQALMTYWIVTLMEFPMIVIFVHKIYQMILMEMVLVILQTSVRALMTMKIPTEILYQLSLIHI